MQLLPIVAALITIVAQQKNLRDIPWLRRFTLTPHEKTVKQVKKKLPEFMERTEQAALETARALASLSATASQATPERPVAGAVSHIRMRPGSALSPTEPWDALEEVRVSRHTSPLRPGYRPDASPPRHTRPDSVPPLGLADSYDAALRRLEGGSLKEGW